MFKFTPEQIVFLKNNDYRPIESEQIEGFENWYVDYDKDTGEYDKGYMSDFEINLYDSNDILRGTAIGGAYSHGDYYFENDIIFEEVPPETELTKFNSYLIEIAHNAMSVGSELAEITAKLTEISQYVRNLKQ